MSAIKEFEYVWTRENATTRRVLHAIPAAQSEFKPVEDIKNARELAFIFASSQLMMAAALDGSWKWPPEFPKAPATLAEVQAAYDKSTDVVKQALKGVKDSRLDETIMFFVGPKTPGEVPVGGFCWMLLLDTIHHRGQLSTYLRLMGADVPSIYGPSKSEPW